MSEIPIGWIVFVLFLILFVGVIIAEIRWLARKGWATTGTAAAFVLVSDLLSLGIASIVVFVVFFIMFMMVMGPAGTGSNVPESSYAVTTAIAAISPPILLVLIKRLFLRIFKIKEGKTAWTYSIVVSLIKIAIVLLPPTLIYVAAVYIF